MLNCLILSRAFKVLSALIFTAALSGCASIGIGQNTHYMISTPDDCCSTFETMAFKVLPAEEKVRLSIDSEDPNFEFDGGFSHYEALALPNLSQPYVLQLESEVVRDREQRLGQIFFPVLTFLDENKQMIKTFDSLPYTLQTPFYSRNHIRSSVKIGGKLSAARYVVIHTHEDKLDQAISTNDGQSLVKSKGFSSMLFAPLDTPRFRINFADKGWVRVLAFTPEQS